MLKKLAVLLSIFAFVKVAFAAGADTSKKPVSSEVAEVAKEKGDDKNIKKDHENHEENHDSYGKKDK